MSVDRDHIESVCSTLGEYKGSGMIIKACVVFEEKRGLLSRVLMPNRPATVTRFGRDWKVLDDEGTAFVGDLGECVDYFLRHEDNPEGIEPAE